MPGEISSVDSGNLAGHLLALGNSCRELIENSSLGPQLLAGIEDPIRLLREALAGIADTPRTHIVTRKQLSNAIDTMAVSLDSVPVDAVDWATRFLEWRAHPPTLADIAQTLVQELGESPQS